jgi:hypothetical protein
MLEVLETVDSERDVIRAWEDLATSLGWDGWDVRLRLDEIGKPRKFE